ncbi:sigma-70 family RNA polymerase sigma factor [Streptomyces lushanensis]|uniref:sigma-70 family RNA polymerase sigma factor n=1 Tax=Streptomyces lushanensis TaxID=1434255 RepID=UPI00082DCC0A|nr:sigma-70 family RNA polymerase sigma factor [Streptomyces lushanensis]
MSSSPESAPHTTGAHRAARRAPRSVARRPPARYEPYLDGLFTYCLSVLCDHDDATAVLGDTLSIAERQHGRCPSEEGERKAWLYALARWACQRKLTEQRRHRPGAHSAHRAPEPAPAAEVPPETAARHRRELALLAWPEAAGTTPEQREILELAVRHRLGPREAAAVLSLRLPAARELLASAACEVERTRAALAVVDSGDCPSVARLTGDSQVLLSAALRRELVRHVDDCPRCRRTAERAEAAGPWPGSPAAPVPPAAPGMPGVGVPSGAGAGVPPRTPVPPGSGSSGGSAGLSSSRAVSPAVLPLVTAPRTAAYAAMTRVPRARTPAPRFGRDGFPMDPKDRAARRDRLRARAVTTTVVATVVAAPVLALWAAYRGAPPTGEGGEGSSVSAGEAGEAGGRPYDHYENTGTAASGPGTGFGSDRTSDVFVEVVSDGTAVPSSLPGQPAPGRITVEAAPAGPAGGTTTITLRASGGAPVAWTAGTTAPWLRLSSHYGMLAPRESVTLRVFVDHRREPSGPWSARIAVYPSGSTVKIHGYGAGPPASGRPPLPGHQGRPGHEGRPSGEGRLGHQGRPDHPGRHGHSGRPPRPEGPGRPGPGGPASPAFPGTSEPSGPSRPGPSRHTGPAPSVPGGPGPSDPGPGPGSGSGSGDPGRIPGDPAPSDPAPPAPPPGGGPDSPGTTG